MNGCFGDEYNLNNESHNFFSLSSYSEENNVNDFDIKIMIYF